MNRNRVNKNSVIGIGIVMLILPFVGLGVAYIFYRKNVFNNPDFWYGYMAYFGTVSLAIVALLQSIHANEISNTFMVQQLRQKIGYFDLKEEVEERRIINKYQKLQMGQFYDANGNIDQSKDKILGLHLTNVGEDAILNLIVLYGKINEELIHTPCSVSVVYKKESICFELDNTRYFQASNLKIELLLQMQNMAGVVYKQKIFVQAEKNDTTVQRTFFVSAFNTSIDFKEER